MIKRYLIVAFLILTSLAVHCQRRLDKPQYYLGAQGGLVLSMVQFNPTLSGGVSALHPYMGGTAGLCFRYYGHKVCGLQVEANWLQRGWHETESGYSRRLDYIEVPLLMNLRFGRRVRGVVNLGPQIGYCIYDKGKNNPSDINQYKAKIDKPFDWGLAGGLGMDIDGGKAGVYCLEARFNYSFGNIFADHATDYFSSSHSMNLSVGLSWYMRVK